MTKATSLLLCSAFLVAFVPSVTAASKDKQSQQQSRADYISRLEQVATTNPGAPTPGSLWTSDAPLAQLGSDLKAKSVNDSIIIRVGVNTTSQASSNVTSQRSFQTSSGISGVAGQINTAGINPLLDAQSSTQLKGTGQTAANSNLQTNLTGQVIAVLGNGNLVIEAQRQIFMNNQRETLVVRGVARPVDVDAFNSIPSSALNNLEIELKGKGILSDSTRPPNAVVRFLLRIIGF